MLASEVIHLHIKKALSTMASITMNAMASIVNEVKKVATFKG